MRFVCYKGGIKKAGGGGGANYHQAHNQLYVFSTQMANRAAESVVSGAHGSILLSHLEDPDTKNFLRVSDGFVYCSRPALLSRLLGNHLTLYCVLN